MIYLVEVKSDLVFKYTSSAKNTRLENLLPVIPDEEWKEEAERNGYVLTPSQLAHLINSEPTKILKLLAREIL